ncbi:universal stress protein [Thermosulfuriphilus ammonigenes]|uniref:Universal stress protein n=1 Tax=Thermosulfuriphilus ammonigenes TaxID=1936021 RepID=A0A6G7PXR2_9BACT|nr:universal stress protein [Thermosulfuriphilus ammonigenes]MBA2849584.1 nucleotide-binding universal stress UspA family protein [Thermosulfuriphilus ammonigenes]QIJ72311.1 universal stress protein [Thermosulfuriphilus ammonigenes]
MNKKWKEISRKIEATFGAAAFAEAGEFEAAREILKEGFTEGHVLLGVEGEALDRKACRYALNLCRSTRASLQVIQALPVNDRAMLKAASIRSEALVRETLVSMGLEIPLQVITVSGTLEQILLFYLTHVKGIISVVIAGGKRRFRQTYSRIIREAPCPVVLVSAK